LPAALSLNVKLVAWQLVSDILRLAFCDLKVLRNDDGYDDDEGRGKNIHIRD